MLQALSQPRSDARDIFADFPYQASAGGGLTGGDVRNFCSKSRHTMAEAVAYGQYMTKLGRGSRGFQGAPYFSPAPWSCEAGLGKKSPGEVQALVVSAVNPIPRALASPMEFPKTGQWLIFHTPSKAVCSLMRPDWIKTSLKFSTCLLHCAPTSAWSSCCK